MAGKKAGFPLLQYNILWDGVVSLQLTQRKHKKGKKTVTKERGLIKCLGTRKVSTRVSQAPFIYWRIKWNF